ELDRLVVELGRQVRPERADSDVALQVAAALAGQRRGRPRAADDAQAVVQDEARHLDVVADLQHPRPLRARDLDGEIVGVNHGHEVSRREVDALLPRERQQTSVPGVRDIPRRRPVLDRALLLTEKSGERGLPTEPLNYLGGWGLVSHTEPFVSGTVKLTTGSDGSRRRLGCPAGGSSLPGGCAAFLRGHPRGASLTTLQSTLPAKSSSRRVFPIVRIDLRRFTRRLIDEFLGKLVWIGRSLARALRHSTEPSTPPYGGPNGPPLPRSPRSCDLNPFRS